MRVKLSRMSEAIVVWFNARCSKCRAVRELLEAERVPYLLRDYLDEPPARRELTAVLEQLGPGTHPREIARTQDPRWAERGLADADPDAVLAALLADPSLLQRPIAIRDGRAVIARPPERVRELFEPGR